MHKNEGMIKPVDKEMGSKIIKMLEESGGQAVPIKRENNQFVINIFVPEEEQESWQMPKKVAKAKSVGIQESTDMDCSWMGKGNRYQGFWNEESTFQRQG